MSKNRISWVRIVLLDNDPAKTKEVKERKEKEYKKWILQRYFKNQEEKAELLWVKRF